MSDEAPTADILSPLDHLADEVFKLDLFLQYRRALRNTSQLWAHGKNMSNATNDLTKTCEKIFKKKHAAAVARMVIQDTTNIHSEVGPALKNNPQTLAPLNLTTKTLNFVARAMRGLRLDRIMPGVMHNIYSHLHDPNDSIMAQQAKFPYLMNAYCVSLETFRLVAGDNPKINADSVASLPAIETEMDKMWGYIGHVCKTKDWPKLTNDRYPISVNRHLKPIELRIREKIKIHLDKIPGKPTEAIDSDFYARLHMTAKRLQLKAVIKKLEEYKSISPENAPTKVPTNDGSNAAFGCPLPPAIPARTNVRPDHSR